MSNLPQQPPQEATQKRPGRITSLMCTLTDNELADRLNVLWKAVTEGFDGYKREFLMSIPAKPNHDADLIISEAEGRLRSTAGLLSEAKGPPPMPQNRVVDSLDTKGHKHGPRRVVCTLCGGKGDIPKP